jgi:hypothetical protein
MRAETDDDFDNQELLLAIAKHDEWLKLLILKQLFKTLPNYLKTDSSFYP